MYQLNQFMPATRLSSAENRVNSSPRKLEFASLLQPTRVECLLLTLSTEIPNEVDLNKGRLSLGCVIN